MWTPAACATLIHIKQKKDKCHTTYRWNLENDTNELIYKTETDTQTVENKTKQTSITKGEEGRGGIN